MQYDEKILQKHAADLYQKAKTITSVYAVCALLCGIVAAGTFIRLTENMETAGLLFGGFVGFIVASIGNSKAEILRLQAQNILVLCQIERNTRP